jgi:hypothetical protein
MNGGRFVLNGFERIVRAGVKTDFVQTRSVSSSRSSKAGSCLGFDQPYKAVTEQRPVSVARQLSTELSTVPVEQSVRPSPGFAEIRLREVGRFVLSGFERVVRTGVETDFVQSWLCAVTK